MLTIIRKNSGRKKLIRKKTLNYEIQDVSKKMFGICHNSTAITPNSANYKCTKIT